MILSTRQLIKEQIRKSYEEIFFIKFIFSFVNCLSLLFILFVLNSLVKTEFNNNELYIKFIEMAIALFAPYLSIVSQGFLYPKTRTINSLRYLLSKLEIDEEDKKLIYGK